MSGLGQLGRFGNQIFQYAFLKICARASGLSVETAPWIGQALFGHNDPPVSGELGFLVEEDLETVFAIIPEMMPYLMKQRKKKVGKIGPQALEDGTPPGDLWGFFQRHTRHYRPHKDYFRSLFQPQEDLLPWLNEPLELMRSRGKTIVAIHVRTGDYRWLPQFAFTLVVPPQWWAEWLDSVWEHLDDPVVYLCSNDVAPLRRFFRKFNVVTSEDLKLSPPERVRSKSVDFYRDYHVLAQADVVGISNSSFSFTAAMLNERASMFVRPHWDFASRFTTFDPWDADPLLLVDDRKRMRKGYRRMLRIARETEGWRGALSSALLYHPGGNAIVLRLRLQLAWHGWGWHGVRSVLLGRPIGS